ncbi:MAG: RNA polymerase-binding protein DksA [Desulfobacterales bacterium]|nr:RNA polymerase-binding protein DksA [Desulfobacterales bacterium]MDD4071359.1 RNA polymerase-binding protein DksA [Desulfobacterales bacterium]MDD4392669.1 RNA polymerase-binding protein DksA [Desulfobacterales bacterium]
MKTSDIEYFKKLLNDQLRELLEKADATVSGLKLSGEELADPVDRAAYDLDQNFVLRIRDRERKLINKIMQALDSIEDGTFGICQMCGDDISIERLKARPVTSYCIKCKTRMEVREYMVHA